MNSEKIIAFNQQQIEHAQRVRELVLRFCYDLIWEVNQHDNSKFAGKEYFAFIESRESLNNSPDGKDAEYQKHLNSDAIQSHITSNAHHPEYWDKQKTMMPITEAIIMYFDWMARSHQRGTKMKDFWAFNTEKLKNQPEALALVEYLRKSLESPAYQLMGVNGAPL